MAEIELRNVTRHFDGTVAVRDVSFTVRDGEFFILVGPSGCGKTTLLNMIVGLEELSSGEIRVDGERVDGLDPRERNMAMVFQSYAIYPHMTVRENIAFPLRLAKLEREEIEQRVAAVARTLELTALLDRKPQALSGGQRQRVAMGRAIVRKPRAFLMDEPLSNLDARLRGQMRAEIARLQRQLGTTTLYVTHDQTEALTLGDRIAVLRGGDIQQIGTPRELYEQPANAFVAGFIGAPAMNFLPARREGGRVVLPAGSIDVASDGAQYAEPDGPLLIGFRPEHLRVVDPGVEAPGGWRITAEVAMLEWLGAELLIHLEIDAAEFSAGVNPQVLDIEPGGGDRIALVARTDPSIAVQEGDALALAVATGELLFFDGGSGRRIRQRKR